MKPTKTLIPIFLTVLFLYSCNDSKNGSQDEQSDVEAKTNQEVCKSYPIFSDYLKFKNNYRHYLYLSKDSTNFQKYNFSDKVRYIWVLEGNNICNATSESRICLLPGEKKYYQIKIGNNSINNEAEYEITHSGVMESQNDGSLKITEFMKPDGGGLVYQSCGRIHVKVSPSDTY
jgi:hypothetical protein